jgi:hypothetical protein
MIKHMKEILRKWWLAPLCACCLTSCATSPTGARDYDDAKIATIHRGETSEAQLLEWFGPPDMRDVKPDGRSHLAWNFARRTDGGSAHSGVLDVSLAPDGKVDYYSARRSPR